MKKTDNLTNRISAEQRKAIVHNYRACSTLLRELLEEDVSPITALSMSLLGLLVSFLANPGETWEPEGLEETLSEEMEALEGALLALAKAIDELRGGERLRH